MSNTEQPDYQLITSEDPIEIRDYSPMILAEVAVCGERKEAAKQGFKILADYLFGNNTSNQKMAMTAPVLEEQDMDKWKIRFVMPKQYPFETLPKPNSKEIRLISLPARRLAVIRFSGFANDDTIKEHTNQLQAYIFDKNLKSSKEILLAFYNPPWTLPFLRRNEVMIEIRN